MKTRFDPTSGLIIVSALVTGPRGQRLAQMALDTGATTTTLRPAMLVRLGYDPAAAVDRIRMTTASGVEYVARVAIDRIESMGASRAPFSVIAHTLPPSATIDGLLGLDFFRGRSLRLDFRLGAIELD